MSDNGQIKLYHKNPRQMTERQWLDLNRSLTELGDLSGIVHDLNSNEVIGGNQRSRVFDINKCEITLTEQLDKPDEQGTVGHGFVIWKGKKYAYRQVRWTPKECEKGNIIANKGGGGWDFDTLANEFEVDDLLDWGFSEYDLGIDSDVDYDEHWQGMPEFDTEDLTPIKTIKVNFATQDDIDSFSELIDQKITEKTRSIWYPKAKKLSQTNRVYNDES